MLYSYCKEIHMPVIDSFTREHSFLSNFYSHPIEVFGAVFPTAEHAFQWAKCTDENDKALIQGAASPNEAKRRGRRVQLRADWEDVKIDIMRQVLKAKFADLELAQQLRTTGDATLIEGNNWGDAFWGVHNGRGQNWLGKLLMEIRANLVPIEIERKFLVTNDEARPPARRTIIIEQRYISIDQRHQREVRIRKEKGINDDRATYYLTIKSGGGLVRQEYEVELVVSQYESLTGCYVGHIIHKTRHEVYWNDHIIYVDEYDHPTLGLVVAEVEFPNPQAAAAFVPPPWCTLEVTHDPTFKNRNIATATVN